MPRVLPATTYALMFFKKKALLFFARSWEAREPKLSGTCALCRLTSGDFLYAAL
jgi:hypothetical protein